MSDFDKIKQDLDKVFDGYTSGDIDGDTALNRSKELTGNYLDGITQDPVSRSIETLRKRGSIDAINAYTGYINSMSKVTASNYGNVNLHDPNNMDLFIDRYKKFDDSVFDRLGFSPYRANDKYYNDHTSGWENHKRVLNTMPGMVWNMMKQTWSFSDNNDLAKEYSMMNSMAYDTRDSGTFYNNMILSSSATLGIMAALVTEKAVGLGITALTAGAGGVLEVAETSNFVRKLLSLSKVYNTANKINRTVKAGEAVKKASRVGEFFENLNPLKNTTQFIQSSIKGELKGLAPTEKFIRGSMGVWADARTANLVYKESQLEANLARNEFIQDYIKDFEAKNGRLPNEAETLQLKQRAESVRNSVLMGNIAAIYLTDKITFNDMLDPILSKTLAKKSAGLPSNVIFGGKSGFFLRSGIKDWIPGNHFKAMLRTKSGQITDWSLGSISEGLQENIQDILADAAKSYYSDVYNTNYGKNSLGEFVDFIINNRYMGEAVSKQFTAQGAETFFSGALMGGPIAVGMRAGSKAFQRGVQGIEYKKVTRLEKKADEAKEKFGEDSQQYKDAKANYESAKNKYNSEYGTEKGEEIVEQLNNLFKSPKMFRDFMERTEHAITINNLMNNVYGKLGISDNADVQQEWDRSLEKAFALAMRTGQMQNIIDHYKDLKANAGEEYINHGAESEQDFRDTVDKAIAKAEEMKNTWEALDKELPTKYHPENYKVGSAKWLEEYEGRKSEEMVKQAAVFMGEDFNRMMDFELKSMSEINSVLTTLGLEKTPFASDISVIMGKDNLKNEIDSLNNQIKSYENIGDIDADNKRRLKTLKEKRDALVELNNALGLAEVMNTYNKLSSKIVNDIKDANAKLDEKTKQLDKTTDDKEAKELRDEIDKINKQIASLNNKAEAQKADLNKLVTDERFARFANGDGTAVSEKISDSVRAYLSWLAKENGVNEKDVTSEAAGSLFNRLLALYSNRSHMNYFKDYLYQMLDHDGFYSIADKVKADRMRINKNIYKILYDSLKTFQRNKSANKLLNDLFDAGFWIKPSDLSRLMSDGIMPTIYYVKDFATPVDSINGEKDVPVVKNSDDYNKAVKIVKKFVKDFNANNPDKKIRLTGISLQGNVSGSNTMSFRVEGDMRSTEDIMDQYGVKYGEQYDAEIILNNIIVNPNAVLQHQIFAQNIIEYMRNNNIKPTVEFVDGQNEPVVVEGNTIKIDLRYAGNEFVHGKNNPEFVMLKGIFSVVTKEMIDKDAKFKDRITALYNSTRESIEANPDLSVSDYPGLSDVYEFTSEAMLNPSFQRLLATIQNKDTENFEYTTKSVWDEFIDAVVEMLKQLTNATHTKQDANMLNSALDVITTKLDIGSEVQETIEPVQNGNVSVETPVTPQPTSEKSELVPDTTRRTFSLVRDVNVKDFIAQADDDTINRLIDKFTNLYGNVINIPDASVQENRDEILNSQQFAEFYYSQDADDIVNGVDVAPVETNEQEAQSEPEQTPIESKPTPNAKYVKQQTTRLINKAISNCEANGDISVEAIVKEFDRLLGDSKIDIDAKTAIRDAMLSNNADELVGRLFSDYYSKYKSSDIIKGVSVVLKGDNGNYVVADINGDNITVINTKTNEQKSVGVKDIEFVLTPKMVEFNKYEGNKQNVPQSVVNTINENINQNIADNKNNSNFANGFTDQTTAEDFNKMVGDLMENRCKY